MRSEEMARTTDDQQRIVALSEAFVAPVRQRDALAEDLDDLLDVARTVRDEASQQEVPTDLCPAGYALDDVLATAMGQALMETS